MRTEQYERADRVGAAPGEFLAVLRFEGFRHEQEAVEPVRKTERGCDPKRHSRIAVADNTSDHRTQSESNPKRSTDQAKRARPFFFRRDIGDVGKRSRNGRTGNAGNDSADK